MKITLPTDLQQLAEQKVAEGNFASMDELVNAALNMLLEPYMIHKQTGLPLGEVRQRIAKAFAEVECGERQSFNGADLKKLFEEIKVEGHERAAEPQAASV